MPHANANNTSPITPAKASPLAQPVCVSDAFPPQLALTYALDNDEDIEPILALLTSLDKDTPTVAKWDADTIYRIFSMHRAGSILPGQDPIVTDEDIISRFTGCRFGLIDNDVNMQRYFLARACLKSLTGYWNGHTVFRIMISLDLVTDTKSAQITPKGLTFITQSFAAIFPATENTTSSSH